MAQTFAIELSDQTQNVMVSDYVHGERLHIRVTNAPKPLVIGLAGQPGGTGQGADATFSKVGTAVSGEPDAYDFVLGHRDIDGVVGEGQAFYFNLWEFDPDDARQEGKVRAVGKVPVGLSIYVPRSAIFPEGEDITATAWPMLAAATDADTPAAVFTAGAYRSRAGTITTRAVRYMADGAAIAGDAALGAGQSLSAEELVADDAGHERSFAVGPVTVAPAQPLANVAPPVILGTPQVGGTLTLTEGTWTGSAARSYGYRWTRNGADLPGAGSRSYRAEEADDGAELAGIVTASDGFGTLSAAAAAIRVAYPAPVASGGLPARSYALGSGDQKVEAAGDFAGAAGGAWSVAGADATIDASGRVTIPTDALRNAESVTVTYANSGGTASSAFAVTVAGAPSRMEAPGVTATSSSALSVDRAAAPASNGSAITGYDLRYSADGTNWTTLSGIADPQSLADLSPETLYHVETRAVNGIGAGPWSAGGSATTGAASAPGTILYAGALPLRVSLLDDTAGITTSGAVTLSGGSARFAGTAVSRLTFGGLTLPAGTYWAHAVISGWISGSSKMRGLLPTYDPQPARTRGLHQVYQLPGLASSKSLDFLASANFNGTLESVQLLEMGAALGQPRDIWVLAGQSNMAASVTSLPLDRDEDGWTDQRLLYMPGADQAEVQAAQDVVDAARGPLVMNGIGGGTYLAEPPNLGVSPGLRFGQRLVRDMPADRSLCLVAAAASGTALLGPEAAWNPSAVSGDGGLAYDNMIARVDAALAAAPAGSRLCGVIWAQGEGDTSADMSAYPAAWAAMRSAAEAHWGRGRIPWLILLGPPDASRPHQNEFRRVQAAMAESSGAPEAQPLCHVVDRPAGHMEDSAHVTAAGQRLAGEILAARVVALGLHLAPVAEPLANTSLPVLSGTAEIGQTLAVSDGIWTGSGERSFAYQWTRDGAEIPGATARTYELAAADDGAQIACAVSASDGITRLTAASPAVPVTYRAPAAAGALPDQAYALGSGSRTVDVSGDFTFAEGGAWSVSGAGGAIDGSGLVTLPTDTLRNAETVTVSYTNSGGTASSGFGVTVSAAAPAPAYDGGFPDLSYENNIAAQTYDAARHFSNTEGGTWSLAVSPETGGIAINAVSGMLTLEPLPIPEGTWTLTVSVTSAAGTASATVGLTITPAPAGGTQIAPPTYDGGAPDLLLKTGAAMTPADLSLHFSGADLAYTASGLPKGVSVDGATGVISGIPAADGTYIVTFTAANGAGAAVATFSVVASASGAGSSTVPSSGGGGTPGAASVSSTGMISGVSGGVISIGSAEAGRVSYFSVLLGGTETPGFTVNGAPPTLVASAAFTARTVHLYSAGALPGTTASLATAAGDTQHVAAFKTVGYRPIASGAFIAGRRAGNDALSYPLACTVPADGAVLLHGKRFDRLATSPIGTIVEETAGGLRGYWVNATGAAASVTFEFAISSPNSEKYATALILERTS